MTAFNDSIGHAKELKLPPSKTEDGDTKTESSWAGMVAITSTFPVPFLGPPLLEMRGQS